MPKKVLVADDSPTIRRRATSTLSEAGHEVNAVEDGLAAWKELESGGADVVLCDILMPGLDGYELCRRIKGEPRFAAIPVLLLRGTFEPWDEAKAMEAGADGYVTKPFDSETLLSTLGQVLAAPSGGGDASPSGASPVAAPIESAVPAMEPDAVLAPASAEPEDMGSPFGAADEVVVAAAGEPEDSPFGAADGPLEVGAADTMAEGIGGPLGDLPEAPPPRAAAPPVPAAPAPGPVAAASAPVAPAPIPASSGAAPAIAAGAIDDAMIERIADRVAARLTGQHLERVAWEVVPDVAEAIIRRRLADIEAQLGDA